MHYECWNENYMNPGNKCPRLGRLVQVDTAARAGYQCRVRGCGARLKEIVQPGKEHGKKRVAFLSKGTSIKYRSPKGQKRKSSGKKLWVRKSS